MGKRNDERNVWVARNVLGLPITPVCQYVDGKLGVRRRNAVYDAGRLRSTFRAHSAEDPKSLLPYLFLNEVECELAFRHHNSHLLLHHDDAELITS